MLKTLKIRNLALAAAVDIDFKPALNTITGETGAGKSMIIGALKLLLGERADKTKIRTNETKCSAEAVFQLSDTKEIDELLEEYGVEPCEDGVLIIRRVLKESGSGTNMVNNCSVTLPVLRTLGEKLVDMHGPYDHQSLLHPETQLEILDAFGAVDRSNYSAIYKEMRAIQRQIDDLNEKAENGNIEQQIEFLEYRVAEINEAELSIDEETEIVEEHSLAANSVHVIELANGVMQALTDGEGCAFDGLAAAQRNLAQLSKHLPDAEAWQEQLESAVAQVQDIARTIEIKAGMVDVSPERLQWLDDRIAVYQTLKRKYGPEVSDVLKNGVIWKDQLDELQSLETKKQNLEAEKRKKMISLHEAGKQLSEKREMIAKELAKTVTAELVDLGFKHGFFDCKLIATEPSQTGMDRIEFGFAPNAGEEMRPLRQIASSGEISRVMLATKAVLARHDKIPLLVFDEIDANVGGEIANAVGQKLAQVATHHQVLCITHLPQVAAHGATHYAVAKHVEDGRTFSEIHELDHAKRVEEIARMLGGKSLTSAVMQHSEELLLHAKS